MNETRIYYRNAAYLKRKPESRQQRRIQENELMKQLMEYAAPEIKDFPFLSKSHSNGAALLAVSTSPVGCDLEKIQWKWSLGELSRRMSFYLSEEEKKDVLSSEQPKRNAILAWTRKESYFKVHQKRKVSDEFYIVTPTSLLQGEKMEFVTKYLAQDMIATCYHQKGSRLEWILTDDSRI